MARAARSKAASEEGTSAGSSHPLLYFGLSPVKGSLPIKWIGPKKRPNLLIPLKRFSEKAKSPGTRADHDDWTT